ncbi:hypothetical protein IE4771_PB00110 (plasmid) [Rhizobium etli bv. mimosae str. IE4771]|uniref:Uncharacterized protein n=1 Tax=Rhizobium etli bv. mimosae str. IE4771 TaxID=1432050 RepID=A0A060IDP3_RHIET|nr:hypothetical protein IE4771_PB00110 [Rhizobium sp. IE4771]
MIEILKLKVGFISTCIGRLWFAVTFSYFQLVVAPTFAAAPTTQIQGFRMLKLAQFL